VRARQLLGAVVIAWLRDHFDEFLGRGDAAVTVPVMDGPLKPNQLLEAATRLIEAPELDNLVATAEGLLYTTLGSLRRVPDGEIASFPQTISCLAVHGDALAIGLEGAGLQIRGGPHDGRRVESANGKPLGCLTAMIFLNANTLVVANGSAQHAPSQWRRDLMTLGKSGEVWRIDLANGEARRLAEGLAWPCGVAAAPGGRLYVSEAWRHRVLAIDAERGGKPTVALADPPAYPGRILAAAGGGYWLSFFTIRNQLVEFILREKEYRRRMINEVPEAFWMAPALAATGHFEEPLQGSGLKQMGMLKPWAATRAYGLVVRCDTEMQPLASYHSRADGVIHGVTSVCEDRDDLIVSAKGPGIMARLVGAAAKHGEARPK
jgi:hypothetical protein